MTGADELVIRKRRLVSETLHRDGERAPEDPVTRVAAVAVLENPFAGEWHDDLDVLTEWGSALGGILGRGAEQLGGPDRVESYGKGAIVGADGELEHAAALLHPKLGPRCERPPAAARQSFRARRSRVERGRRSTFRCTTKTRRTSARTTMRWKFGSTTRRADEIVLAIALTDGSRPHPRIGGLKKRDADD